MAASGHILVGDIGGTNSRLAITACDHFHLTHIRLFQAKDFPTFEAVLAAYVHEEKITDLKGASLAPAGPIEDDHFKITNNHWPKSSKDSIRAALSIEHVHLINDFEAVAYAIAHLPAAELVAIGTGTAKPGRPVMAIGPGTGLGMAYIVTSPEGRKIVQTAEPGPCSLPMQTERELAIATLALGKGARHFNEALVSGGGLLATYRAIAELDNAPAPLIKPSQVTDAALAGTDAVAVAALDQFLVWLGRISGDFALALGALGGVYLGGGIPPKVLPRILTGPFRAAFDDKPPLERLVKAIPVYVITSEYPALSGCAAAFLSAYPHLLTIA